MSSFVWMKVLESAPERYDRGIDMLARGKIRDVYARIAALAAAPGKRVLDIGCGTGGVSLACAANGAAVTGIDIDAGMLEQARNKPVPAAGSATFLELGAAEIADRFGERSFDAVVSCLAISELSPDEADYVLRAAFSRLVPGGILVIADEVVPDGALARALYWLRRLPVAAWTYLSTQTTTRPVRDLARRIETAGFRILNNERMLSGDFLLVQATREAP